MSHIVYKQWTNERTFARKQIVRKPIKETCEKNDWSEIKRSHD